MHIFVRKRNVFFSKLVLIVTTFVVCEAQRIPAEVNYEEDIAITAPEKQALDKFKTAILPKIPEDSYIQNYIKDDLYFIKWLRAGSFNVKNAESLLLEHLKWRESQRMDTVSLDEFLGLERDYPFLLNITDKKHRPTGEVWFGDYKIREAALTGKGPQVVRWVLSCIEMLQRQVYEARSKGVRVSQAVLLGETEDFSIVNACPTCLPIIGGIALGVTKQYPGLFESAIIVNVPFAFNIVLQFIKPILGPGYANLLKTFVGKDKWGPYIGRRYERSQISLKFGGTRTRETQKYR